MLPASIPGGGAPVPAPASVGHLVPLDPAPGAPRMESLRRRHEVRRMNLPLLDFATRTPPRTRSLIHGESDRTRAGTALAILAEDPTGRSMHWPLVLAAYRQLWTGYKGHTAWRRASDLLTSSLQEFAADRDFLKQPDLVAAFLAVDGTRLEVAALSTTLVAVRQGQDVLELGPDGFHPVPEIGALQRESGAGLWRASLALGEAAVFCVMARAAAGRVGVFRLREALMADAADDLLAGLGAFDEPVLAARMNRGAHGLALAGAVAASASSGAAPMAARVVAASPVAAPVAVVAPPAAIGSHAPPAEARKLVDPPSLAPDLVVAAPETPAASSATAPPGPSVGGSPEVREGPAPFLIRSGRRHRAETRGGWLDRWRGDEAPGAARPDPAGPSRRARVPGREHDLFSFAEPEAAAPVAEPESVAPVAQPEPPASSISAPGPLAPPATLDFEPPATPEFEPPAAPGLEPAPAPRSPWSSDLDLPPASAPVPVIEGGGVVIPTRRIRQQMAGGRSSARPEEENYLLRRWFTWSMVGLGLVLALVVIILIGRFLTGGGPAGPRVKGIPAASEPARTAETGDEDGLPPAAAFTGASWTRTFKGAITSSPLLAADRVIVGGRDGNLYAFGASDGADAWRLAVGSGIGSSPAACGPLAVVGTYGGDVVAADLTNGSERWRFKTNGKVVSSPAYAADLDLVVIGSHDHHVYALAAKDGSVAWKVKTGGVVWASPAIAGDRVYIGSHDRALYCLDLTNGNVVWKATAGGTISTTAAIASDRVIVGTTGGEVAARAVADGERLWTAHLRSACGSAAVLAGDNVLIGTDGGSLFALRTADGGESYRVRTGGAVKCRPAIDAEGNAWITSYDGRLRVLDSATGAEKWGFPAQGRLYSSPAVLGRTAFFGSMDGGFYAATWPEEETARRR